MKLTEKNIRFQVAYTIREYWEFEALNGECFEWDGDEYVEQTMYGVLNARQFLWLVFDKELTETINTQGIQIEGGYIIPAVDFYEPDELRKCFVSVYTDDMMKLALSQSETPAPTPVVQKDFSVQCENISFVEAEEIWGNMVDALPEIVNTLKQEEDFYSIDDDILDRMVPKLLDKLNIICEDKQCQS